MKRREVGAWLSDDESLWRSVRDRGMGEGECGGTCHRQAKRGRASQVFDHDGQEPLLLNQTRDSDLDRLVER
jgi:hypothetical protein